MSRNLDATMAAALASGQIMPCFMVQLAFATGAVNAWTGVGSITYDAVTYLGVGSLGGISAISEGSEVKADGTVLTLSGIDPTLLTDCLTEIQLGAAATILFGLFSGGGIIGAAYPVFVGTVDKPTIKVGVDTISISLALENRLVNLQRSNQRRYTAADQRLYYPDDSGFNFVEILNDIALRWG